MPSANRPGIRLSEDHAAGSDYRGSARCDVRDWLQPQRLGTGKEHTGGREGLAPDIFAESYSVHPSVFDLPKHRGQVPSVTCQSSI